MESQKREVRREKLAIKSWKERGYEKCHEIIFEKRLVLTLMIVMILTGAWIQIVDAPPLESLTLDDVPCYQIDNNGRIIDGDGRLRGWIRGALTALALR